MKKESQEIKADLDPGALQELRDQKEIPELLASQAHLESKDLEVSKENLVTLESMERKVIVAYREILGLQDNLDFKDLLESLEWLDRLESKEMPDNLESREISDLLVLLVCKGLLVIKVHLALKVLLV